jgi:hypothetical protein
MRNGPQATAQLARETYLEHHPVCRWLRRRRLAHLLQGPVETKASARPAHSTTSERRGHRRLVGFGQDRLDAYTTLLGTTLAGILGTIRWPATIG